MGSALLIVAAAAVLGALVLVAVVNSDGFGLALIGVFAMVAWEFPELPVFVVGGIGVHMEDVPAGAFLVALAFRGRSQLRVLATNWLCWLILIAMFVVSLYRGQHAFGLQPALNELRVFAYLLITTAWVATIPAERATTLVFRWARALGWLLVALSLYHIGRFGLGSADSVIVNANGDSLTGRSLFSGQALVLAAAGFISAYQATGHRTTARLTEVVVFLGFAFLSQNRSVWAAAAVGMVIFLCLNSRSRAQLAMIGVAAAVAITVLLAVTGGGTLADDIQHSATSQGTYDGREQAWTTLIDASRAQGPITEVFGAPLGSGYTRVNASGAIESYAPHNQYVTIYLRTGIVGLLAFVGLFLVGLFAAASRPDRSITIALIAMVAVYAWVYQISWYAAPLLGWALLRGSQRQQARVVLQKSRTAGELVA